MKLTELEKRVLRIFESAVGGISATEVQNELFAKYGDYYTLPEISGLIATMSQKGYLEFRERISFGASIVKAEITYGLALPGKIALRYKRTVDGKAAGYLRELADLSGLPITVKNVARVWFQNKNTLPPSIPNIFATLVNADMATYGADETSVQLTTFGKNVRKIVTESK